MQSNRFVSIGTYLPSAMLVAVNFTIMAIALWMRTGFDIGVQSSSSSAAGVDATTEEKKPLVQKEEEKDTSPSAKADGNGVLERQLAAPLTFVVGLHLLGLIPLYIFNNLHHQYFTTAVYICIIADLLLPLTLAALLTSPSKTNQPSQHHHHQQQQQQQKYHLIKSFSLLLLGLSLSTLSTLNFSLSFMIGLLCTPLTFLPTRHNNKDPNANPNHNQEPTTPLPRYLLSTTTLFLLNFLSPPVVLLAGCWYAGVSVETVLAAAAFGWDVWGMWTQVVVWCVWWPGWVIGGALVGSLLF